MAADIDPNKALSREEAAALLGVTSPRLKRWTDAGLVPFWFVDEVTGFHVYHAEVFAASQRRAGELHAERMDEIAHRSESNADELAERFFGPDEPEVAA